MSEPLVIVGAGGHARETAHAYLLARAADRFLGFLDDRVAEATPEGWPILGSIDLAASYVKARFVIAINDPRIRRSVAERLTRIGIDRWGQVVHPDTRLHASVEVGLGCSILGGVQLTTNIRIGNHCIMNRGSQVSHDCTVGDFCSLNPGACIAGNVTLGPGCELGSMCSVRQGTTVGAGCTVGMGAVVLAPITDNAIVVGNPAQPLRFGAPW
jgi:sugar O-acyltransferase (sialic acid O-acetyltransferase NeuD family)